MSSNPLIRVYEGGDLTAIHVLPVPVGGPPRGAWTAVGGSLSGPAALISDESALNNNNDNLIYIAPACRMTSEALERCVHDHALKIDVFYLSTPSATEKNTQRVQPPPGHHLEFQSRDHSIRHFLLVVLCNRASMCNGFRDIRGRLRAVSRGRRVTLHRHPKSTPHSTFPHYSTKYQPNATQLYNTPQPVDLGSLIQDYL